DGIGIGVDRSLTGIDNVIGLEAPVFRLARRLAHRPHADPDEILPRLRRLVSKSRPIGEKLLHGSRDGVMNLRIMMFIPALYKLMALVFEAEDDTGPVKPGAAVGPSRHVR